MKNVTLENQHLIVRGYIQGTVTATFSFVFFIIFLLRIGTMLGYLFLALGVFLFILAAAMYIPNSKKKYLEIYHNILLVYPTGSTKIYYEIPINRIAYFTKLHKQKSSNNNIFAIILNDQSDPCFWVNGAVKEKIKRNEVDLDYFPIKDKFLPEFNYIVEKHYGLLYKIK